MKRNTLIIIFFLLGIFMYSQNKEKKMINSNSLIDGLTLDNSIFANDDIDLNKYNYNGTFIEKIKIHDLLNKQYRDDLIKFLLTVKHEDDEFKSTLLTQLLMMRIIQLSDNDSLFILSEISKNQNISYNGIELYPSLLINSLLKNPVLFINESSKHNDIQLLEYIMKSFAHQYIIKSNTDDDLFLCNTEDIEKGMLLVKKEHIETGSVFRNLRDFFENEDTIQIDCAPSLSSDWKSSIKQYYNIKPLIDSIMEKRLDIKDKIFYKVKIVPILNEYYTK